MAIECRHIDNGFYRISDRGAGIIARTMSPLGRLPKNGHEARVIIDGHEGWLGRTAYGYRNDSPSRGWVWALYRIDPRQCPSLEVR